jgi:hypothetical protein
VHKETIVACVRIMVDARVSRECRTFDTTTAGLTHRSVSKTTFLLYPAAIGDITAA